MPLMINAAELKGMVDQIDQAPKAERYPGNRWTDRSAELPPIANNVAHPVASHAPVPDINESRAQHVRALEAVVTCLRNSIIAAEDREPTVSLSHVGQMAAYYEAPEGFFDWIETMRDVR
ncbi:hypothetical protein [Pseudomonas graminis]|uniref:Uncharacterized protein n=1 Tax=Pseudomonas graminis TaxID=158627 RepID=A0A1I0HCA2_9PSED|nr:hypothetical protein [Pseudomonas graminis]SET80487.1 hypothetical protein SAMN05216197_12625 [Pseudomonas graminis]